MFSGRKNMFSHLAFGALFGLYQLIGKYFLGNDKTILIVI